MLAANCTLIVDNCTSFKISILPEEGSHGRGNQGWRRSMYNFDWKFTV